MEIFDVKRRDIVSFKDFMKAHENATLTPSFDDWSKNDKSKLRPFMRDIRRDVIFSHDSFDPTYRAMEVSRRPGSK